uniref:Uncharacterized protein n=1 Tax=Romanomermis culicivorax TaxID=13658 RepID=A0A915K6L6_ROMCU
MTELICALLVGMGLQQINPKLTGGFSRTNNFFSQNSTNVFVAFFRGVLNLFYDFHFFALDTYQDFEKLRQPHDDSFVTHKSFAQRDTISTNFTKDHLLSLNFRIFDASITT